MSKAITQPSDPDTAAAGFDIRAVFAADFFPHEVTALQLRQTHISWVVLTGHFAYKIKKPVRYPFLDASTLERRRLLCEEELRLNRRMAPDLYLDVVRIVRRAGRLAVADGGGEDKVVEYAVRMRQFDPAQELDNQLAADRVTPHEMAVFAVRLADFHARADTAPADSSFGSFELVRAQMLDNFEPLQRHLQHAAAQQLTAQLRQWTQATALGLGPLMEARRSGGRIRECHGDLHARNIVRWQLQWQPFDCLEFDPQLRWIDVLNEVAFLYMDLIAHNREDLAHEFLSRYLENTGDYSGLALLPLYSAYRALVRAKIDALSAESASAASAHALDEKLLERLHTAASFMNRRPPALILTHGVTACGKSWLSERLVPALRLVRIRSDLERKRLAGVHPLARRDLPVGAGDYDEDFTRRTYARLLDCAGAALTGGLGVVVDATFLHRAQRKAFQALARDHGCPYLIVACSTDRATLEQRIDHRTRYASDPSEATSAVLQTQLDAVEPPHDSEQACVVNADTSWLTSADAAIREIERRLTLDMR